MGHYVFLLYFIFLFYPIFNRVALFYKSTLAQKIPATQAFLLMRRVLNSIEWLEKPHIRLHTACRVYSLHM